MTADLDAAPVSPTARLAVAVRGAHEPFAALDALTRLRMHDLLHELRARHAPATLLVTHDVDEAIVLADRIAVLVDGRLTHWTAIEHSEQRRRGSADFDSVRTALLAQLGVVG